MQSIRDSFAGLIQEIGGALPDIIAALVVFLVGLFIAPILGRMAARLMQWTRIDDLADKAGVTRMFRDLNMQVSIANAVGTIVRWFIILAFLLAAANILNWDEVTSFLYQILLYVPNVIVAVIILALGMIAGNFLQTFVREGIEATNTSINRNLLGNIAKWSVVAFSVFAALNQLHIAEELVQILFAGIVLALALAFGLGGREKAAQILNSLDQTRRPSI
jgi:hypothetical protein